MWQRGQSNKGDHLKHCLVIENTLAELSTVQRVIEQFCTVKKLPEAFAGELMLIAEELVVNTIQYGYGDSDTHAIEIEIELAGQQLVMCVVDDGLAFNPLKKALPELGLPSSQAAIGGLGIPMVLALSDRQEYKRECERNIFRIYKSIN